MDLKVEEFYIWEFMQRSVSSTTHIILDKMLWATVSLMHACTLSNFFTGFFQQQSKQQ